MPTVSRLCGCMVGTSPSGAFAHPTTADVEHLKDLTAAGVRPDRAGAILKRTTISVRTEAWPVRAPFLSTIPERKKMREAMGTTRA